MKKSYRVLLLVLLFAFTLVLVSCKGPDQTPLYTVVNLDPEELVVEDLNNTKSIDSVEFHILVHSGTLNRLNNVEADETYFVFDDGEEVNSNDLVTENRNIEDAIAKDYVFTLINGDLEETITIRQFKLGVNSDLYTTYVSYLTYDDEGELVNNGSVMTNSYIFTGEDLEFYKISSDGVEQIPNDDITFTGFPVDDELIVDRKYINHETINFNGETSSGLNFDLRVRIAATDAPLNVKTASFWNWIFLQVPIMYLMAFISGLFNNSFAIGIILTTIIVRTIAWPIYAKTNDMSMKMSLAQPDMQRLERKYALKKDPESQQRKQMEMMALYKKHNINMFGCFLPILQMPIFFAMFQVVRRITIPGGQFYQNVSNTKFFGTELAGGGMVAKIVFTALVGTTMYILQKISQKKPSYAKNVPEQQKNTQGAQSEQTMKTVSMVMIFMMVMTAFVTPGNALSFYWIIGNIYSIGQTLFNRHMNEVKYKKLQEEKLYGGARNVVDAEFKDKGDK